MKLTFKEYLAEAGKVHTLRNPGIEPKGAPEPGEAARAFDKKPKDRSYFRDDKPGYHAIEYEMTDDAIWVHVKNNADFEKNKEQRGDSYYGVNVLFHDGGKIEASTGDKFAAAQWREDKDKIIKVAQAFMKKKNIKLKEAKSTHKDGDIVKPHKYSVKILSKGKDTKWPALKGEIYEKDVLIGTFSRGAVQKGYIPPIVSKFRTTGAKARFEDFSDSLSVAETIEALLP